MYLSNSSSSARRFLPSRDWFRQAWDAHWLPWLIIGVGFLLRLREYLFDRSMWLDESIFALHIMHSSLRYLFNPEGFGQAPPVGFALLEKMVEQRLGSSEYAFRLIPFLAGITGLVLFYRIAKRMIAPRAVPIAAGLFAISWPLIYFSSETTQYSLDVLAAVGLYALALPMQSLERKPSRILLLGVLGAFVIWFSLPSAFILGGIGLTLGIECWVQNRLAKLRLLVFPYILWSVSFGLYYWTVLRFEVQSLKFTQFWGSFFMPFPPRSATDVNWYFKTLFNMFELLGGIQATGLGVALFGIGCTWLRVRRDARLFFLTIPIVLTLVASAMHLYPFGAEWILFLVPALILLVAEGVDFVRMQCSTFWVAIPIVIVLFLMPTASALRLLFKPDTKEEMRPVIEYIRAREKPGDILYVSPHSSFAYRYYAERESVGPIMVVDAQLEATNAESYFKDPSRLRGRNRVWILFSHISPGKEIHEKTLLLHQLDLLGKRIEFFQAPGASVYLYSLADSRVRTAKTAAAPVPPRKGIVRQPQTPGPVFSP